MFNQKICEAAHHVGLSNALVRHTQLTLHPNTTALLYAHSLKAMIRDKLREHGWADNLKQYTKGWFSVV